MPPRLPRRPAPRANRLPDSRGRSRGTTTISCRRALPARFSAADPSAAPGAGGLGAESETEFTESAERATDSLLISGSANNGANSASAQLPAFGNYRNLGSAHYRGALSAAPGSSALDARPFSLTGRILPKPDYSHLTVSASVGGPLWIPRLVSPGRAPYVFLNYERTRSASATVAQGLVPEPARRQGDFSATAATVVDPSTGTPFPGNRIPAARISTQAKHLLALYPRPAFASVAGYNYQVPLIDATHRDVLRSKALKTVSPADFLVGDLSTDSARSDHPSLLGFLDTSRVRSINSMLRWNRIFSPRLISALEIRVSRNSSRATPFFAGRRNISGEAGILGNDQDPLNWGPPSLSFTSGIAPLSDGRYSFNRTQTAGWSYSVHWSRGGRTFKFGGGYSRTQLNSFSQQNPRGAFLFTGAATNSDLAGLLLGIPDTASIAFGNADKYFRSSASHAFFNADWRARAGLSVSAGIRWEYASPVKERYGRLVNLDITHGFAAVAPVVAADPVGPLTRARYPAALIRPDTGLVQPRFGFAWRPIVGNSLVVRGGYGIYADLSVYQSLVAQMAQQAPLSRSLSVQHTPETALTLAGAFSAPVAMSRATFGVDPNFQTTYAQNWQLSIQQNLPLSMVSTVEYLGIKGTHLKRCTRTHTRREQTTRARHALRASSTCNQAATPRGRLCN